MISAIDPLARDLAAALGNGLLQGLPVAACVLAGCRLARRLDAASRYAVAFAGLLVVAALPIVHLATVLLPHTRSTTTTTTTTTTTAHPDPAPTLHPTLPTLPASGATQPSTRATPAHPEPRIIIGAVPAPFLFPDPPPQGFVRIPPSQTPAHPYPAPSPSLPEWLAVAPFQPSPGPTLTDMAADAPPAHEPAPVPAPGSSPSPWQRLLRIPFPPGLATALLAAWITLAAIRLAMLARQCIALRGLKKHRIPVNDGIRQGFDALRESMGVRRPVLLGAAPDLSSAMAVGFLEPAILIPTHLAQLPPASIEPVIRHELAHVRRFDDATNLLQQAIKAVFFFHPAVLALCRRLNLDREIACDDHVLAATHTPRDYALLLTDFASRTVGRRWAAAPAAWSNPSQLQERIHMILDPKRTISTRVAPARTGALTLVALLAAATGIAAGPRLSLEPSATSAGTASVDPAGLTPASTPAASTTTTVLGSPASAVLTTSPHHAATLALVHSDPGDPFATSDTDEEEAHDATPPKPKPGRELKRHVNRAATTIAVHPEGPAAVQAQPALPTTPSREPRPPKPPSASGPYGSEARSKPAHGRYGDDANDPSRALEERLRNVEKLVESIVRRRTADIKVESDIELTGPDFLIKVPKAEWKFLPRFEDMNRDLARLSEEVQRSVREAELATREALKSAELAREHDHRSHSLRVEKEVELQHRGLDEKRRILRKQIEAMQNQIQRLESQLERLDDQVEAAAEAAAEAETGVKPKAKVKVRTPDAAPAPAPAPVPTPAPAPEPEAAPKPSRLLKY